MLNYSSPYVFRKSDLDETDLRELIDKERRHHYAKRKRRLVNLDQASKILGISKESIQEYVENGILKQSCLPRSHCLKRDIYFSEGAIKNLKKQATNYSGLISANVATKMLNKRIRNFFIRYVNTGRLKAMLTGGKPSKHFFRRKDVEAMVKLENETIGSRSVAVVLNVSMSSIYRMTLSKELNPISGPGVDGYPVNLFLQSDVEELKVVREAFKSECVRIGKTTRFGKSSSNRSCPIQEKVICRVKQLLAERASYAEAKQRMSGLELHRQLVKEGYKIGTTTIYKILHKQLGSTSYGS